MSNPPDLKTVKTQLIENVIGFYHEDFTEYYATVIALTEQMPEQINNEIRNAFSHLARVQTATSQVEAEKEAEKAQAHVERACRDCLKASIIAVHDDITNLRNRAVTLYQAIDPVNTAQINALFAERSALNLAEARGEKDLTDRFQSLLEQGLALRVRVAELYGSPKGKFPIWLCHTVKVIRESFSSALVQLAVLAITALTADALNLIDMLKAGWHNLTGH